MDDSNRFDISIFIFNFLGKPYLRIKMDDVKKYQETRKPKIPPK